MIANNFGFQGGSSGSEPTGVAVYEELKKLKEI